MKIKDRIEEAYKLLMEGESEKAYELINIDREQYIDKKLSALILEKLLYCLCYFEQYDIYFQLLTDNIDKIFQSAELIEKINYIVVSDWIEEAKENKYGNGSKEYSKVLSRVDGIYNFKNRAIYNLIMSLFIKHNLLKYHYIITALNNRKAEFEFYWLHTNILKLISRIDNENFLCELILELKSYYEEYDETFLLNLFSRFTIRYPNFLNSNKIEDAEFFESNIEKAQKLKIESMKWKALNSYQKSLLLLSVGTTTYKEVYQNAKNSKYDLNYIQTNWKKLIEFRVIIEFNNGYHIVNDFVLEQLNHENTYPIMSKIIRGNSLISIKPIFNSKKEYDMYTVLITIFPNHLVFPNMSLQTIFNYNKIKELINREDFDYYLRSQVDFCIVKTTDYLPIIGYEVDSDYHDEEDQILRDEKKNRIFETGGIPLIRLRISSDTTFEYVKSKVSELTKDALELNNFDDMKILVDLEKK